MLHIYIWQKNNLHKYKITKIDRTGSSPVRKSDIDILKKILVNDD